MIWHSYGVMALMTLTLSSLSCLARSSFRSLSRSTLISTPTHPKLTTVRRMSDATDTKVKSDEEWRAILSPEQVCVSVHPSVHCSALHI
ncbi:hypothetical protein BC827DRAFT_1241262 [Russula dissimulans]|nr:hypothetical protein BC827DRAFT_1241262 [Russula dissimulans]